MSRGLPIFQADHGWVSGLPGWLAGCLAGCLAVWLLCVDLKVFRFFLSLPDHVPPPVNSS